MKNRIDKYLLDLHIKSGEMVTKEEAEFWAWLGTVERHRSSFNCEFDLFAQGCPKYLLRAICDVFNIEG